MNPLTNKNIDRIIKDEDCRKESPALEFMRYGIAFHFLGKKLNKIQ